MGSRDMPRLLQYAYSSSSLEAELLDIAEVSPELREKGARWLSPEDEARGMGLKYWLKEGRDPSVFPAPSGLDGLRYLKLKQGVPSDRTFRNLKASEFNKLMEDTFFGVQALRWNEQKTTILA